MARLERLLLPALLVAVTWCLSRGASVLLLRRRQPVR